MLIVIVLNTLQLVVSLVWFLLVFMAKNKNQKISILNQFKGNKMVLDKECISESLDAPLAV